MDNKAFDVKHDEEVMQDHPDFARFSKLVTAMSTQQIIDAVAFDNQALSATLMMILLRNHKSLNGHDANTLAAVIANMVVRDMPKSLRDSIKRSTAARTH